MAEFPYIRAVLEGPIPDLIVSTWQEVAKGHRASGRYADSLSFAKLFPYEGKPLSVAVANTAPHALALEEGHEGFHLPSSMDWGAALARGTAKLGKRGPFLRIPFRHMVPRGEAGGQSSLYGRTVMPREVYVNARRALAGDERAAARVAEAGRWLSRPYDVMARGARGRTAATLRDLTARAQSQLGQPGYTWSARQYEGLTHKEQRNAGGRVTGGGWFTWRTITPNSLGWFIPAVEGYHFARETAAQVAGDVRDLIADAARHDVADLVSLKVGGLPA